MKKTFIRSTLTVAMVLGLTVTSFAAQGKWVESGGRWWFDNGDGSYKQNGWHWVDGNYDGTAECYYFDSEGWLIVNGKTPDGYTVDANGAWIENGVIHTKQVEAAQQPAVVQTTEKDEFTGTYLMSPDNTSDRMTVVKNADGTYHFTVIIGGAVQLEKDAVKGELKHYNYDFGSYDEILFTDAATGKTLFNCGYGSYPTFTEYGVYRRWEPEPDYDKLASLKANRKLTGTFIYSTNTPDFNSRLLVEKKKGNLYNFKYEHNGEVWHEFDATPVFDKYADDLNYYDFVEFVDSEGFYQIGYSLGMNADYYTYWLAGEGWTDVWAPIDAVK